MKGLISRFLGRSSHAAAHSDSVGLALFGKHPAWGDHIDNLGDDSEWLAGVRAIVYQQGVARQIESGAWENLPENHRLDGFDHEFLWIVGPRMIAGLIWSSSDRRGRTLYPLCVAADLPRAPGHSFLAQVFATLQHGRTRCVEAHDQPSVGRAVQSTRDALRALTGSVPESRSTIEMPAAFSPGGLAVARVLHELRNGSPHLSPAGWPANRTQEGAAVLRVPVAPPALESLLGWMALVASQVHADVPALGIVSRAGGFADLLLGNPTADNFFCLRASPAALPPTTEVPFEIAPEVADLAPALLETLRSGRAPAATVFGPERPSRGFLR